MVDKLKKVVYKLYLLLSILLLNFNVIAQPKEIRLEYDVIEVPNSNFCFEQIKDNRLRSNGVGVVDYFGKVDSIYLKGGLKNSLFKYLRFIFPIEDNKQHVVLKISRFSVHEKIRGAYDSLTVKLRMEFFKKDSVGLNKIFETQDSVLTINKTELVGIEKNIKVVLARGLTKFINANKTTTQPTMEQASSSQGKNNSIGNNSEVGNKQEAPENRKSYFVTVFNKQGINANGWAFSVYSYPTSKVNKNGWIIPWVLSVEINNLNPYFINQTAFQSVKLNYYSPGFTGFKKVYKSIWVNLGIQFPIGTESLTDNLGNVSTNIVFGLAPSQGIYYISNTKVGLVFGIGFYEKIITSISYPNDLGMKLELGIKF